jgi:Lon protease-like protein
MKIEEILPLIRHTYEEHYSDEAPLTEREALQVEDVLLRIENLQSKQPVKVGRCLEKFDIFRRSELLENLTNRILRAHREFFLKNKPFD